MEINTTFDVREYIDNHKFTKNKNTAIDVLDRESDNAAIVWIIAVVVNSVFGIIIPFVATLLDVVLPDYVCIASIVIILIATVIYFIFAFMQQRYDGSIMGIETFYDVFLLPEIRKEAREHIVKDIAKSFIQAVHKINEENRKLEVKPKPEPTKKPRKTTNK